MCEIIILYVVVHGCATYLLSQTKEHRMEMFYNKVTRRMFGPKREDRENYVISSIMISDLHEISFVSQSVCVGSRPLGHTRHRWEDNVKIALTRCVCCDCVE